ncbi:MAG: hypothetical protein EB141_10985, partial [Verrucomicrobia bacterium]|nr:hypothetical protein [Verrucomicrobiota bacterium]NDE99109.1 hypothetical protein [Verrucomicrobiota bacterium]
MKAATQRKSARRSASLISRAMAQQAKATRPASIRADVAHAPKPVPAKDRRLNFGSKWDYAPAPEDAKYIPIAPRH